MNRHISRTVAVFLFLISLSLFTKAQLTSEQVDSLVHHAMNRFNVAGVAVGIVKDNRVVHLKGYGVTSVTTQRPVDPFTDFAIASNSKAFTTLALAILVEEGKLHWEDKVVDHIPEFRMYNPYVTENFNIVDLLTHRSGLGLGIGDLMIFPDGSDFTIEDILRNFQFFQPVSAFRTKFDYDNLLYLVAGELIKRVSGESWEDFVTERIINPLHMDHTFASVDRIADKSNTATPHSSVDGRLVPLPPFQHMINGAAGGIYSNVADMCRWMMMHLNKGRYGDPPGKRLISESSHDALWRIYTVMPAPKSERYHTHFAGYGLGWMLSDMSGMMSVSHTGGLPGMLTKVIMIPDIGLGVVVLTNTSDDGAPLFASVSQAIVDSYLGLDNRHWVDRYYENFQQRKGYADSVTIKVWETVEAAKNIPVNRKLFTGVYEDPWFGKVEVYEKDGAMRFRSYRSPKLKGTMFFYNANTFAIRWDYRDMNADAFALFTLNEEGEATEIRMKGISPDIDFSFDFQDLRFTRVR